MIFIGAQCKTKNCNNSIALQELKQAPQQKIASDNPDVEHPFIVKCDVCGETHSYTNEDLSVLEGQLPD